MFRLSERRATYYGKVNQTMASVVFATVYVLFGGGLYGAETETMIPRCSCMQLAKREITLNGKTLLGKQMKNADHLLV